MFYMLTSHGTYYLVNPDANLAKRFPGPDRQNYLLDDDLFEYTDIHVFYEATGWHENVSADEIKPGCRVRFDTPYARAPWRLTSEVTEFYQTPDDF
jgi:hypothetical protein